MRRPVLTLLTLASAALAVAAVAVWVSSAVVSVRLDYTAVDRSADPILHATDWSVATAPHRLTLMLTRVRHDRNHAFVPLGSVYPPGLTWREATPSPGSVSNPRWLAPAASRSAFPNRGWGDGVETAVAVPFWAVIAAAAVLPAWRLWRWAGRLRRPPTACPRCGYDVRASPGRCPECGTAAVTRPPPRPSA